MQCQSCEIVIDHKWKFAIEKNVCPNCGQAIMDEVLKELLSELAGVMLELQAYPNDVSDWLAANYHFVNTETESFQEKYVEIGSERFREMVPRGNHPKLEGQKKTIKVRNEKGEEVEEEAIVLKSQDEMDGFANRAFGKNSVELDRLRALKDKADKARRGESETLYESQVPGMSEIQVQASEIDEGGYSSLGDEDNEDDPPAHILQMAQGVGGKDAKDLMRLNNLLKKNAGSSNRMRSGGGSFSR